MPNSTRKLKEPKELMETMNPHICLNIFFCLEIFQINLKKMRAILLAPFARTFLLFLSYPSALCMHCPQSRASSRGTPELLWGLLLQPQPQEHGGPSWRCRSCPLPLPPVLGHVPAELGCHQPVPHGSGWGLSTADNPLPGCC